MSPASAIPAQKNHRIIKRHRPLSINNLLVTLELDQLNHSTNLQSLMIPMRCIPLEHEKNNALPHLAVQFSSCLIHH